MRRLSRTIPLVALVILGGAAPASAHADLLSSDPAAGATVPVSPNEIRLTFSEVPDLALSAIEVLSAANTAVETGATEADGDGHTLITPVPDGLPDGVYTVTWRVVSTDDGHVTSGAFPFAVGTETTGGASTPTTTTSGPTPLAASSKAALYAGLMLVVAAAVVGAGLFRGAVRTAPTTAAVGALVATIGAAGFLVAQQRAAGVSLGRYLGSAAARPTLWILVAAVVTTALAMLAQRIGRAWSTWAAGAAAAITLGLRARSGHAAAAPLPALAELLQWMHMLAAACWIGGLVLLLALLGQRRGQDPPVHEARRFSWLALAAVFVVVLTGIARSISELGGPDGARTALDTSYGRTLLTKVLVVVGLIGLGAVSRFRGLPHLGTGSGLRTLLRAEALVATGVLVLTGTLTSLAPPTGASTNQGPNVAIEAITMSGADFATTIRVDLTVTPGTPGPNGYRAAVIDYDVGTPIAADTVTLRIRSITRPDLPPSSIELHATDDVWTAQALEPSSPGTYRVDALVATGATTTMVPLTLITRSEGTTTTTPGPDGGAIASCTFRDGVRIGASSTAGYPTQVHLTAFTPGGMELRLREVAIVASPGAGEPRRLLVEQLGPGHVTVEATLTSGEWTIDTVATARDGRVFQCTWPITVS